MEENRPLRILVVDDGHDAADSLAMLLGITGHEVHVAYDGLCCLDKASAERFDAVLLDIGMPQLDGFAVARQIREHTPCKSSLIVAVTGYADEAHRQQGEEAGFDDYFVKPIDPMELIARLRASSARPRRNTRHAEAT
jgi:DNA-binding response OmpR family regulator